MKNKKLLVSVVIAFLLLVVIGLIIGGVAKSVGDSSKDASTSAGIENFDRKPRRPSVLCLSPSFVEMMYRINREDHITAVTDGCDFPSDAKSLPNLGSSLKLDWKLVEKLPIDVVLLLPNHSIEHAKFLGMGKKVIEGRVDSINSICDTMWAVGQLYNEEDFIEQWIMDLDLSLTVLKKKATMRDARGDATPKVLVVLNHNDDFSGEILVSGLKLFYSDVVKKAGGENAFQSAVETASISFAELVALEPDIVIDIASPVGIMDRHEYVSKKTQEWRTMLEKASTSEKQIKVEVFAESWARRPGPRVVELLNNVGKVIFDDN
jgi:ABC-type hemin transport system substrate-binding protein